MTVKISQTIKAPIEQVYHAFTNSTNLREWLCDYATTSPKVGGRIYMAWNSGFYTSGEFTQLIPNKAVEFTWVGRSEPAPTCVEVTLSETGDAVEMVLEHTGLGEGPEWEDFHQEFQHEWERSLRNLVSVLETGADLRITRRPMLGIFLSDFNPEIAARLNVPVQEGIRIEGTIDGLGAQKAGLLKNDVIVSMDGHPITTFGSLAPVIQAHEAGDEIVVEYYRGPEKHSVQMKLGQRPIPDIIWDPGQLADKVSEQIAHADSDLEAAFQGVTEDQAARRPSSGDWNAKEILAHLILVEQGTIQYLASVMTRAALSSDGGENSDAQTRAVVAVYQTVPALLEEFKRCEAITIETIRNASPEFVARKSSYWQIAFSLLQGPVHTYQHIEQIKTALQS